LKKIVIPIVLIVTLAVLLGGCNLSNPSQNTQNSSATAETTAITAETTSPDAVVFHDYTKNPDGTWTCNGITYKYRLEITGRMTNAACDSTFVYLSNLEEITFAQAWKAAGFSSNSDDYFDYRDAVLVEWR